jgi:hypothetical protein
VLLVQSNIILPTVFDLYNNDRLIKWKQFRDSIETSQTPLEDVAHLWSRAPFVSSYLNPLTPDKWPDPWHLVLNSKLDELAIVLGMLYTLKLTQRFIASRFEIHMSTTEASRYSKYFLVVDNHVLNLEYGCVLPTVELGKVETSIIWTNSSNK